MDAVMAVLESLFRWLHVLFGILWIGHLYFLNFVNASFEATLDADAKKKVIPELRPRVLFWFRWGAAFTWITGVLLLLLVYYHGGALFDHGSNWSFGAVLMIVLVFAAPFIYDALVKSVMKELQTAFVAGLILSAILVTLFEYVGGFGIRGYAIHLGATFGTIMAFNVWFRIWPAQQQIIQAIKQGQPADPTLVALAGQRSRHNTYMSVPLLMLMVSQHATTWIGFANPIAITLVVFAGWMLVYHLYDRAAQLKGF
ncbi:MAG: urate hydroxylase PuuD [Candidatus Binatia bacterium]|nr:urate hydroxylase PuuD [Candidatus Binatia bacterium]